MINQTLYDTRLPKGLAIYLNQFYEYSVINKEGCVIWFNTPRGYFQAVGYTIEETIQKYERIKSCWKCRYSLDFILNNIPSIQCAGYYVENNKSNLEQPCRRFEERK